MVSEGNLHTITQGSILGHKADQRLKSEICPALTVALKLLDGPGITSFTRMSKILREIFQNGQTVKIKMSWYMWLSLPRVNWMDQISLPLPYAKNSKGKVLKSNKQLTKDVIIYTTFSASCQLILSLTYLHDIRTSNGQKISIIHSCQYAFYPHVIAHSVYRNLASE